MKAVNCCGSTGLLPLVRNVREHPFPGTAHLETKTCQHTVCPGNKCRSLKLMQVQRSGDESAAVLDYDIQNERVTLTVEQPCR